VPATSKKHSGTSERRPRRGTASSSGQEAEGAEPGSEDLRQAQSQAMDGIGGRLRARRVEAGLSLRQLARDLDVSASFLSQVENGKTQPSVATLYLICSALELSIDELFAGTGGRPGGTGAAGLGNVTRQGAPGAGGRGHRGEEPASLVPAGPAPDPYAEQEAPSPVVTPAQRRRLFLDSGVIWEQLSARRDGVIDFMFVRYDVGGSSTPDDRLTRHAGVEYGFVIRGTLEITLGFETYLVGPGDAIAFESSVPHRLSNIGREPVEAVWFVRGRNDPRYQVR
jgi:DNA-binding XRE family transcriptional regulator/mannose-6-phosphate isomerase-like protein (cupin superfamily)